MLDILLDFSAYIDPTATDNPNRPDNVIAIQAFIHSNIITRIFKLTENVNWQLKTALEAARQNNAHVLEYLPQERFDQYKNILHKSFCILGNISSNPGKDKIST
jgi:phosphoglycerate-specific signal transduction histidine kinase